MNRWTAVILLYWIFSKKRITRKSSFVNSKKINPDLPQFVLQIGVKADPHCSWDRTSLDLYLSIIFEIIFPTKLQSFLCNLWIPQSGLLIEETILASYSEQSGHVTYFLWTLPPWCFSLLRTIESLYSVFWTLPPGWIFLLLQIFGPLYLDLRTVPPFLDCMKDFFFYFVLSSLHLYISTCYLFCKFTKYTNYSLIFRYFTTWFFLRLYDTISMLGAI